MGPAKTGKVLGLLFFLLPSLGWAEEFELSADLNRRETALDESVTLTIKLEGPRNPESASEPEFSAPEFDVLNQYTDQSSYSGYSSGSGIFFKLTFRYIYVLRPKSVGTHIISGIRMRVGSRSLESPDLRVSVTPAGAGAAPPPRYGTGGNPLRGSGKPASNRTFFLKAEANKARVYRGEQIIVSYYLYERVNTSSPEVLKYPSLQGFLREELEMPIVRGIRPGEIVVVDGTPFRKKLLIRYAAYALKEGQLTLDPMTVRAQYFTQSNDDFFGQDPFFNFFNRSNVQTATQTSESVQIEVLPLPESGRPADFSGAVGDFQVDAALNVQEIRAGEAMTLTYKIEGRGNLATIEPPQAQWPQGLELYDTKSSHKNAGGYGQKTIEYLLIPRQVGVQSVPKLALSFFDPTQQKYVTRASPELQVRVVPGDPGASSLRPPIGASEAPAVSDPKGQVLGLLEPGSVSAARESSGLNTLRLATFASVFALVGFMLFDGFLAWIRKRRTHAVVRETSLGWKELDSLKLGDSGWDAVLQAYAALALRFSLELERIFLVPVRSLSRRDLGRILSEEKGLDPALWSRVERCLEFCEWVQFSKSTAVISERQAREQWLTWLREAESLCRNLENSQNSA